MGKANGLNPNDASDANEDCTGDGYTNIENILMVSVLLIVPIGRI